MLNKEVIAVNQDALGRQGYRVRNESLTGVQVWRRELLGGVAVLLFNGGAVTQDVGFEFAEVGFDALTHVSVRDLYAGATLGLDFVGSFVAKAVPPHGVRMLTCQVPLRQEL